MREKDYEKEKDRDGYRSSKHGHYRDDREERRKERDDRKYGGRDWDDVAPSRRGERERSGSVYREELREKREVYEDRIQDERAEKVKQICFFLE